MTSAAHDSSEKVPLSTLLRELVSDQTLERIAVGDLLAALGDRALGSLLFVLAIPNVLPRTAIAPA